jgi:hypothetical protein
MKRTIVAMLLAVLVIGTAACQTGELGGPSQTGRQNIRGIAIDYAGSNAALDVDQRSTGNEIMVRDAQTPVAVIADGGAMSLYSPKNQHKLLIKAASTQSTPPFIVQNSSATQVASIDKDGALTVASLTGPIDLNGGTLTVDADADTTLAEASDDTISLTSGAATGLWNILTGNLKVGNGTPGVTLNGEDAYVEGTLEVDGAVQLDGAMSINGGATVNGGNLSIYDDDYVILGDGADVTLEYDTAMSPDGLILSGTTTDIPIFVGLPTTSSFDLDWAGSTTTSGWSWDASADTLALYGPSHPDGFNSLPSRYELRWVAGQEGLPDMNATAWSDVIDARFELLGTNASADDVTYYAEGGLTFETDGADHDQVILLPHLDSNQSPWTATTWGTDREVVWEALIRTTASISDTVIWAGLKLTNTSVTATDNDQVFFRYQDTVNDHEWQAVSSVNDSDDAHDTNVAVAAATSYHLKIVIGSTRVAKMYINGVLVETTAALTNAVDLIPYIGVQTEGAGPGEARSIVVRGQAISRAY